MPQIYLEPSELRLNEYYVNLGRHFSDCGYSVAGAMKFWRSPLSHIGERPIVLLSWQEDSVAQPTLLRATYHFASVLMKLAILFIFRARIIWIRHNFKPHSLHRSHKLSKYYYYILLKLIGFFAFKKVSHAQFYCGLNPDHYYVPHPLYLHSGTEHTRDIDHLIFGRIMRYKGIISVLKIWPQDKKLLIAGRPDDQDLLREIETCIESRSLDVHLIARALDNHELDNILSRTKTVVVGNEGSSMIASGALMHALSFHCSVIARHNDYAAELKQMGLPIFVFEEVNQLPALIAGAGARHFTNQDRHILVENFGSANMQRKITCLMED